MRTAGVVILVYCVITLVLFGNVTAPLALVMVYPDRLGLPWREVCMFIFLMSAILLFTAFYYFGLRPHYATPLVIGGSMILSILTISSYAEYVRQKKVFEFQPDSYVEESFARSLQEAPRDFQKFLHAAALKNCRPYAWSYRQMAFYELPTNVAVNVLPGEWRKRCNIQSVPQTWPDGRRAAYRNMGASTLRLWD